MSTPAAQFTAVMRAPIVYVIDDQPIPFPTLTAAELAELAEAVRAEWWSLAQKNPNYHGFDSLQRYRVRQEIDEGVIPITEIIKRVGTFSGADWCVKRSLTKAGYAEDLIKSITESIPPNEIQYLAERITRIKTMPMKKPRSSAGDNINRPLSEGGETPPETPTGEPSVTNSGNSESMPIS